MKSAALNRLVTPLLILFSSLCFFCGVKGQDYTVNYRHIGLSEGISHQEVNCFLQDKNGLMWMGTQHGLNRFDGKQFEIWTKAKDSLSSSRINYLMEDQEGWIWAITTAEKYSKNNVRHISLVHSVSGEVQQFYQKLGAKTPFVATDVQHFFAAPDHSLFFWAKNQLWKYESTNGFRLQPCPEAIQPPITSSETDFWGVVPNGVVRFDKNGQVLEKFPYLFNEGSKTLVGDHNGTWLIEYQKPLAYFSAGSNVKDIKTTPNHFSKKESYFDAKRQWLWYSNIPEVLAFDTQGKKVFDFQTLMGENFEILVTSFFVDQKGLIWMGTRDGFYVMELKDKRFKKYLYTSSNTTSVKKYKCRGLLEHEGQLFVNSYQGAMRIDLEHGRVMALKRPNVFPIVRIHYSFHESPDGRIWSLSNHISEINGRTGEILGNIEIPGCDYAIRGVHTDQNGILWLGTGAGLSILKDKVVYPFRAYNGFASLEQSQVLCFHETSDGTLWLGTDSGLYVLDPEEGIVDHFWADGKGEHYFPGTQIQHIHEDEEGHFWMATEHEGLIKWHPETKKIQQLTRAEGLPTNTIYAIYQDQKDFLWISSNFGLIQMDKHTFRKKIYLAEDGISDREFNRFSHFQAADGRIFFGGQNGVTAFYPHDFWATWDEDDQSSLQVYRFTEGHNFGVERIDALDRLKSQETLKYPHSVRTLSFKILSPDFFLADKISYYYQVKPLDGSHLSPFSGEWIKSEGSTVNILGLIPGRHEITIEARGLDKERIGRPLTYDIWMTQPFFRTWIFWVIVSVLVLCGFLTYFQLRARNMIRQKQLLEQKVKERTQQILKDQQIIHQQAEQIRQLDSLLNSADERWAKELDEVVRQSLSNLNLNIADIADEMNLSRTHFFRKIKTVTGLTPNQYLQEARLNEARRLLESGEYNTVKAASLSVGFKNPSYFSTLFKERFGFSPTYYFQQK